MIIINKTLNFAAIGGDLRQIQVVNSLAAAGHRVSIHGFSKRDRQDFHNGVHHCGCISGAVDFADIVILPLPYTLNNGESINAPFAGENLLLEDVISVIQPGKQLFAGKVDAQLTNLCAAAGINCVDYLEREELAVCNAVPTAEGAIEIAMRETPFTLHGSNCLCLGFGRIGKVLAKMLHGIGAKVSVAARKPSDISWISAYGYTPLNIKKMDDSIGDYDVVFNTVPQLLLDSNLLSKLKKNVLVVDLASKPGGVAFDIARELGIKVNWELSLPGRVAPQTAGKIISDTILNIINNQEV